MTTRSPGGGCGLLALVLCAACGSGSGNKAPEPPPAPPRPVSSIQTLKDPGGRVDWSHTRNLIAFDRAGADGYYDVYLMNPDGSGESCLTCDKAALPNKHIGNPAWHPTGDWIVFQAQSRAALDEDVATPGAGIKNDLWVTDAAGQAFWKLTSVDPFVGGVLHAHFSHGGDKLLWSQRVAASPGLYGQWALKVADFAVVGGVPGLRNIRTFQPGEQQRFYESHGFTLDDRKIIFSGNLQAGQNETGIDVYLMDLETGELTNLTNTMNDWDEHAQLSPSGTKIVWMSSMQSASPLLTDYWLMNLDGSGKERITFFNQSGSADFIPGGVTSGDSAWNAEANRIVAYIITSQQNRSGRTVMLNLSRAVSVVVDEPDADAQTDAGRGRVPGAPPATAATTPAVEPVDAAGTVAPPAGAPGPVVVMPETLGDLRLWDAAVDRMARDGELARIADLPDPLLPGRRHERFVQVHEGVPVVGAEITRQTDAGQTLSLFGTLYQDVSLDSAPALSEEDVRAMVARREAVQLGPARRPRLVVLPSAAGAFRLAYQVRVATAAGVTVSFVDAHDGRLLDSYGGAAALSTSSPTPGQERATAMDVMPMAGAFFAVDRSRAPGVRTLDLRGDLARTLAAMNDPDVLTWSDVARTPDRVWRDEAVAAAHRNTALTYDVLSSRFGRSGLAPDVPIVNIVHPGGAADPSRPGPFDGRAFYAGGGVVVYGDRSASEARAGRTGRPLSSALDIVAHELAHGVIEYSSRLIGRGESGALGEAFADILAVTVERAARGPEAGAAPADYVIGEAVAGPAGLRSLRDPSAYGQADHYDRRFTGDDDNGGVHVNAGIAALSFYLAIEGGVHPSSGVAVEGLGSARREAIERVFYRAFVFLLPADASFAMARRATIQAARDEFGPRSDVERAVAQAWTAVGVQ